MPWLHTKHRRFGKSQRLFLRSRLHVFAVCSLFLPAATLSAEDHSATLAIGNGARGLQLHTLRVALQRHWNATRWHTDNFHFTGYWDLSLARWDATSLRARSFDDDSRRDTVYALALAPVLRLQFNPFGRHHVTPFAELAVGVSLISAKDLRSYALGSHFQFEDRGVLGLVFGNDQRFEIAYQRLHYSNLNLASDNHGVDTHQLRLGMKF